LGPTTISSTASIGSRRAGRRDRRVDRSRKASRLWFWFDILIAAGCLGGLTVSALWDVRVRAADFGASDFKTLYSSVWCFAHGLSGYTFANIQNVFVANGVVQPEKWFGHAPVYPWTTLALLSPLAAMGMVPAAYVLTILSGALMAVAVAALMRYSADNFDMGPVWRVALAILFASEPLVGFAINLGNVSVPATAFCILAFVWRKRDSPWGNGGWRWVPGAALAAAFVLKPHMALWVGIGMLLLPERAARAVVVRAGVLVAGFTALTAAALAATGTLAMQTHDYLAMLSAEASTGASMSAKSRLALPVVSEITSLDSILGFWIANPAVRIALVGAALLGLGWLAVRFTRRVDSERAALLAVGAWCALGLLATYHRTADAMLLLLLLPWAMDWMRRAPWAWHSWAAVVAYSAMCVSWDFPVVKSWTDALPANSPMAFLLLRQAGLADCVLLVVLLLALRSERAHKLVRDTRPGEATQSQAAA
jgi:hypothetical protein